MKTPYEMLIARIGPSTTETVLMDFCTESNRIEGESHADYNDIAALKLILDAETITEEVLFNAHTDYSVGSRLERSERGAWRKCPVMVGKYSPPAWGRVPPLMCEYIAMYNDPSKFPMFKNLDSWGLHCSFEKIHPFVDFNGRTGRALWLRRAIEEGYDCSLGFLHKFYYQTLSHYV